MIVASHDPDQDCGPSVAEAITIVTTREEKRMTMVERVALMAVVEAVRAYLPPDGISPADFIGRVIAAVDNPEINPVIAALSEQSA